MIEDSDERDGQRFVGESDEDYEDKEETITCWCGATGTAADLFDDSGLGESDRKCGGSGVLDCECGGDGICVCHYHGQTECPGCDDCQYDDDFFGENSEWDDAD